MPSVLEELKQLRQDHPTSGWTASPTDQRVLREAQDRIEFLESLVDPSRVRGSEGFQTLTLLHPEVGHISVSHDPRVVAMLTAIILKLESEAKMYKEAFEGVVKGGDLAPTVKALVDARGAAVDALAEVAAMPCQSCLGEGCPACHAKKRLAKIQGDGGAAVSSGA